MRTKGGRWHRRVEGEEGMVRSGRKREVIDQSHLTLRINEKCTHHLCRARDARGRGCGRTSLSSRPIQDLQVGGGDPSLRPIKHGKEAKTARECKACHTHGVDDKQRDKRRRMTYPHIQSLRLVRRIGLSAPGAACMLMLALAMYVDSVHTRGRIG